MCAKENTYEFASYTGVTGKAFWVWGKVSLINRISPGMLDEMNNPSCPMSYFAQCVNQMISEDVPERSTWRPSSTGIPKAVVS